MASFVSPLLLLQFSAILPAFQLQGRAGRGQQNETGAGVGVRKDQGGHNLFPVVHSPHMPPTISITTISTISIITIPMQTISLHPKLILQYRPLACLLPSSSQNTACTVLFFDTPILSFLPCLPFQGEKGSHSHCSSLQGTVSPFSPQHSS